MEPNIGVNDLTEAVLSEAERFRSIKLTDGNLEKSLSLPIADSLGVNVKESERERNGIIRGQFCGVRRAGPIFRGALMATIRDSKSHTAI